MTPQLKTLFLLTTLIISLHLSAQEKLMFDTSKIDASTRLIGRYPKQDQLNSYSPLNFYIEDPTAIKTILKELTVGKVVDSQLDNPYFLLCLIQDNFEVETWIINPRKKSAISNGRAYQFDIEKVKALRKQYAFRYKSRKVAFNTQDEYDAYLTKQKANPDFIFSYPPEFRYEGSFEISFTKNDEFPDPDAIADYLGPKLQQVAGNEQFSISFREDAQDAESPDQYILTIEGSKRLFENFKLKGYKNRNWKPSDKKGWFFYKK